MDVDPELDRTVAVALLDPAAAADATLVERLAALVNRGYAAAEAGLWRDGAERVSVDEVAGLVVAGEIAVATAPGGRVVGSMRVHDVRSGVAEMGILVADPDHRGVGVGRALAAFAESRARDRGLRAIQLELLVPRTWRHPVKEFLTGWYGRLGYRLVGTGRVEDAYPHLAPLLATPCDLQVHEKEL